MRSKSGLGKKGRQPCQIGPLRSLILLRSLRSFISSAAGDPLKKRILSQLRSPAPPTISASSPKGGHHRICSKSYSMIPRLDVTVDRKRRARPVRRAALCGQHTALEPVTERLRGTIPILAARTDLRAQGNVGPTSCSPTSLRSAGNTSDSAAATSGRPNRSNRRFRRCQSCAPRSSTPLTVRFRTDSAMTPLYSLPISRRTILTYFISPFVKRPQTV
jgi:hypothetical protein